MLLNKDVHQDIVLIGIRDSVGYGLVQHDQAALMQLDKLIVDVLRAPPGIHVVHFDETVSVLGHIGEAVALGDGYAAILEENPLGHLGHGTMGEIQVHVIEVADRTELATFDLIVFMKDAIKSLREHGTLPSLTGTRNLAGIPYVRTLQPPPFMHTICEFANKVRFRASCNPIHTSLR